MGLSRKIRRSSWGRHREPGSCLETKKSGYVISDSAYIRVAVGLDIEAEYMGFEMAHKEMAKVDKEFAVTQTESAMEYTETATVDMGSEVEDMGTA